MKWTFLLLGSLVWAAAPPVVTDLQPRGAKKGRPFTLTLVGRELSDVLRIHSTMPATFTPLSAEIPAGMMATPGRYASFLVEPKSDLATGVFPIRIETAGGISNIQLFSIGEFPELQEEETKPNSNDSIEAAQSLPASAVTVTGTLRGAERDFYRIPGKAGERRVIEVEGRRIGSAIDPVVRVFDQSGRQLAKSEDAPLLGLDARVDLKLPKDGFYYVEVHDARFSTQGANFYRLKSGSYDYPADLFPLGGKRGEIVEVSLGASTQRVDLTKVEPGRKLAYVSVPNAAALPLPFDVGEFPEVREPVADALKLPVTINGRIAKPGETDRYELNVTPGGKLMLEIKAREMGTSKLMAVVDVTDMAGKRLARAGDEPLPDNLYAVGASKTAGDPYLFLEVPKDVNKIQVSIEDLALRGGQHFAYRLIARPAAEEFTLSVNTPLVNVPAGGSVFVPVTIDRKGYMGPVRVRVKNAPEGLIFEGGRIPGQPPNTIQGDRGFVRNGVLMLSAKPGFRLDSTELEVEAVGQLADGREITATGRGPGMSVAVNGATLQGSVDRQRPVNASWLGHSLPAGGTDALPVQLEVLLEKTVRKDVGDEFYFRWRWKGEGAELPASVSSDMVSAQDTRAIEMARDPKDPKTGTFTVTTTRLTVAGDYDFYIAGRVKWNGQDVDVYSRPILVTVKEAPANAAPASDAR
ncbi:MAG: hypothetical protein ACK532_04300 [Acidobacteriota bacterium]